MVQIMTATESVRIGIIGLGNMGTQHARSILSGAVPGMVLGAVADMDPARTNSFEGIPQFNEPEALIRSGLVNAVLIATPHFSHPDLGILALQHGLHVLVEKPVAVHKADAERLNAAHAPDSPLVFAAMFNQRTDPRYRELKRMIDTGVLGKIQRVSWTITEWYRTDHYYNSGDWRATWAGEGGGVLLNQCPHQLDLWQWLFGLPQRVIARCQLGRFHDIEVEDSVSALLEYESGLQGVFVTTTGEAPGVNRLEVAGDLGQVVIEPGKFRFLKNEVSSIEFCRTSPQSFERPPFNESPVNVEGKGPQHNGILANFAAAIAGTEPLIAPAAEGIRSVELANAMLLSSFLDRAVSLPIDGAEYARHLERLIAGSRHKKKAAAPAGPAADMSKSF